MWQNRCIGIIGMFQQLILLSYITCIFIILCIRLCRHISPAEYLSTTLHQGHTKYLPFFLRISASISSLSEAGMIDSRHCSWYHVPYEHLLLAHLCMFPFLLSSAYEFSSQAHVHQWPSYSSVANVAASALRRSLTSDSSRFL